MEEDKSLVDRAKTSYRENSIPAFLSSCASFTRWTVSTALKNRLRYPRQQTWEIAGTSATFHVKSVGEYESLERTIRPESEPLQTFIESARDGDTFFDIGAHLGVYSCLVGNAANLDGIYAFEPHPANVQGLRKNLERNETDAEVVDVALSNEATTTELLLNYDIRGELEATIVPVDTEDAGNTVRVETVMGDDFVAERETGVPDLVKIDVEGEEYEVIDGLEATLSEDKCRLLYCEVHERGGGGDVQSRGHERSDIVNRLREFGFDISEVDVYSGGTQIFGRK
jgi:FkbM family methyltransferase